MVKIVAWNSQGSKWDALFDNWLHPYVAEDVVGVLTEAGWPPWMPKNEVRINNVYPFTSKFMDPNTSSLDHYLSSSRKPAFWIPWAKSLDGVRTNSRCSMGGVALLRNFNLGSVSTYCDKLYSSRPAVRVPVNVQNNTHLTIIFVHLISGYPNGATAQLDKMISSMAQLIPQGSAAVILGDMNINLLTVNLAPLPKYWRVCRTNGATQQSGGELDWALFYDPGRTWTVANPSVLAQYKTVNNASDHSVILYEFTQ